MIYRLIIFIGLFSLLGGNINAQLEKSVLKKVYKQQKQEKNVYGVADRFKFTREELNKMDSLSFINQKMDTVYLLETYNIETGISYGCIWNKYKILNYTYYNRGGLEFKSKNLFTNRVRMLVSAWDIQELRKEEERGSGIVARNNIFSTRIIIGKKTKIDFFTFDEFFDFERDTYE